MATGLDVGARHAVVAREGVSPETERAAYVTLPTDEMVLDMLSNADAEYVERGDSVFAVGDAAADFADMFNATTEELLPSGILTGDREAGADLLELLVARVAGEADGDAIAYAVPPAPVDAGGDALYHRRTLDDRLTALSYDPAPIDRATAVGYAELAAEDHTGLAIALGAGTTDAVLLDRGAPVARVGLARGGRWIDEQVAEATDRPIEDVAAERDAFDLENPGDDGVGGVLSVYYENLLSYVAEQFARKLDPDALDREGPLPVAVAGDAAIPDGVAPALADALAGVDLQFEVGDVRVAADPRTAAARGALVAATERDADAVAPERALEDADFAPALAAASSASAEETAASAGDAAVPADADGPEASLTDFGDGVSGAGDGDAVGPHGGPAADAVSGSGTGASDPSPGEDGELRAAVAELESAVAALSDRVDELAEERGTDVSTGDGELDAVDAASLRDDVGELSAEVEALSQRIEDGDAAIDDLSDDLAAATGRLDALAERVDEQVAAVESAVGAVENDVEALGEAVESIEGEVAALDGDVDAVRDRTASLSADLDRLAEAEALAELRSELAAVRERVDEFDDELDGTVAELKAAVNDLDGRVDAAESALDGAADAEALADVRADLDEVREGADVAREQASDARETAASLESEVETARDLAAAADDREDPRDDAELRRLAAQEARRQVLAPVAGAAGLAGLVAGSAAALLEFPLAGVALIAVGIACLAVAWRVR